MSITSCEIFGEKEVSDQPVSCDDFNNFSFEYDYSRNMMYPVRENGIIAAYQGTFRAEAVFNLIIDEKHLPCNFVIEMDNRVDTLSLSKVHTHTNITIYDTENISYYMYNDNGCESEKYSYSAEEFYSIETQKSKPLITSEWQLKSATITNSQFPSLPSASLKLLFTGYMGEGTLLTHNLQTTGRTSLQKLWPVMGRWNFNEDYTQILLDSIGFNVVELNKGTLRLATFYPSNSTIPEEDRCVDCEFTFEAKTLNEAKDKFWKDHFDFSLSGAWHFEFMTEKLNTREPREGEEMSTLKKYSEKPCSSDEMNISIDPTHLKNQLYFCGQVNSYFISENSERIFPKNEEWKRVDNVEYGGWAIKRGRSLILIQKVTDTIFEFSIERSGYLHNYIYTLRFKR